MVTSVARFKDYSELGYFIDFATQNTSQLEFLSLNDDINFFNLKQSIKDDNLFIDYIDFYEYFLGRS